MGRPAKRKTAEQRRREERKAQQYLGNPNLKKADVVLEYTEEQLAELRRCADDVEYFCANYMKIVHVDEGEINFTPYKYQCRIMKSSIENRFTICKLPRQSGKTTAMVGLLLWFALFSPYFSIAILANKADTARKILSRLKFAYEKLPFWMQQGVIEWNKGNIELENGSKVLASSTTGSAVRGDSYNLIYLDEFAFVDNNIQDEFFASVYPTISSGSTTRVLITSTPRGLNMFYKMWTDAVNNNNDYNPIDIHWSETPGRDEEWKANQIRNTSEQQFAVEFECEFIGSTNTLIDPVKLRAIPYIRPRYFDGESTRVYEEAKEDHTYAIVCDSSQGVGGDYSAFPVIDVTTVPYKVVAVYRNNKISTTLYPNIIFQAAKNYNSAYVLIETNDIGDYVAKTLHGDLEYEHVLTTTWKGRSGQVMDAGFGGGTQLGVRTTNPVKRIGCATLKTIIESDRLIINDFDIVSELSTFIANKKGTGFEADEGCNDDLTMCLVLFAWMTGQQFFKDLTNIDIRKNLTDANMRELEDESAGFLFSSVHADTDHDLFGPDEYNEFNVPQGESLLTSHPLDYSDDYGGEAQYDAF